MSAHLKILYFCIIGTSPKMSLCWGWIVFNFAPENQKIHTLGISKNISIQSVQSIKCKMTQHDTWHDQLSAHCEDIYADIINADKKEELLTTALIKISSTHPQRDGSCCVVVVHINLKQTKKIF